MEQQHYAKIWELVLPNEDSGSYFSVGHKAYIFGNSDWVVGEIVRKREAAGLSGFYDEYYVYDENGVFKARVPAWCFGAESK